MIPAKIVKVIYDRRIYAKDGHLIMPKLPYTPEEFYRRHADPSLMAGILTNKFLYHLPIHRQLNMFVNAGAKIARSTLYDWCGTAIDALEGLYYSIRSEVLKGNFRKQKFHPDKIREYRIRYVVPIFHKFKNWLEKSISNPKILDETLIGKAISYAYREFKALTLIFDDGFFKADNNAAERAMRPCKLGMNNYLFFGNHESARRGAIIYTIIESCKLNGINVFEYLTDVFSREPQPGETYDMFLPNRWNQ